mmetsp:Transcript_25194/g.57477  ORF Transcript_25194/g.57477 Transcript_25194/m.57477 type:complete len:479 (-) Transcript_25194:708-2144(-)
MPEDGVGPPCATDGVVVLVGTAAVPNMVHAELLAGADVRHLYILRCRPHLAWGVGSEVQAGRQRAVRAHGNRQELTEQQRTGYPAGRWDGGDAGVVLLDRPGLGHGAEAATSQRQRVPLHLEATPSPVQRATLQDPARGLIRGIPSHHLAHLHALHRRVPVDVPLDVGRAHMRGIHHLRVAIQARAPEILVSREGGRRLLVKELGAVEVTGGGGGVVGADLCDGDVGGLHGGVVEPGDVGRGAGRALEARGKPLCSGHRNQIRALPSSGIVGSIHANLVQLEPVIQSVRMCEPEIEILVFPAVQIRHDAAIPSWIRRIVVTEPILSTASADRCRAHLLGAHRLRRARVTIHRGVLADTVAVAALREILGPHKIRRGLVHAHNEPARLTVLGSHRSCRAKYSGISDLNQSLTVVQLGEERQGLSTRGVHLKLEQSVDYPAGIGPKALHANHVSHPVGEESIGRGAEGSPQLLQDLGITA